MYKGLWEFRGKVKNSGFRREWEGRAMEEVPFELDHEERKDEFTLPGLMEEKTFQAF